MLIPCVLTLIFSLFSDNIQIGQGGNSLENRHLGKEILLERNGLYKSMDVEEYVLGVLPGTIPADYDRETLKVQAILIRTNILKEMQEKNTGDAADLSYQYLTVEERIALWGDRNYENYERRMEAAVAKTAGKVLVQGGELITALYHEVSVGKTASAQEILGSDISYLQSVDSSQDVEAKHYMNLVTYTWEELQGRLDAAKQEQTANAADQAGTQETPDSGNTDPEQIPIQIEESTEHGFVKQISVAGTSYTGEEAMRIFDLTSTNFYVEEIEGGIRFICLGKGTCLGVSQYGANCMAQKGKTLEEILTYYYQGVSLADYKNTTKK
ncbi:MAG: SpoIID/LytB domain-containing protein [Lachnospiraceae bacterium]|nr:SpoIID/LytB domain-containing protein [Lachnospiraceae bacterium]